MYIWFLRDTLEIEFIFRQVSAPQLPESTLSLEQAQPVSLPYSLTVKTGQASTAAIPQPMAPLGLEHPQSSNT